MDETISADDVERVIDKVVEQLLSKDKTRATREQVVEATANRIKRELRDTASPDKVFDPYSERISGFHDELAAQSEDDYHDVIGDSLREQRNRLFWAAFLSEEAGEVSGALVSGETPKDFETEVADVVIVAFGIADVFGFDMFEAFERKMAENDEKPKQQDGTGKLPADDERWRDG